MSKDTKPTPMHLRMKSNSTHTLCSFLIGPKTRFATLDEGGFQFCDETTGCIYCRGIAIHKGFGPVKKEGKV